MSRVKGPPGTTEDAGSLEHFLAPVGLNAVPEEKAQNDAIINAVCPFYTL